ncbi:MAG TPA: SIR2 family protein [Jatrophihabitans sp.]|uniref:SIR2 family protein n=1 Tax=Jatrophihabitans sp. TaxID=1932789 RepID=UPI002F1632B6
MDPERLFVFAGAGLSFPAPTSLPTFNQIRDEILIGLDLAEFVRPPNTANDDVTIEVATAEGLFPEPFLHALSAAGFPLTSWLADILGAVRPNAAHTALAELALAGARVWTVNYDHNIERAVDPALSACAWPAAPGRAQVMKPHGSLGGDLIATTEQVVRGLDEGWLAQLRRDLDDIDTAVFLGYSGRDLDFHPYWDGILGGVRRLVWFDLPGADRAFKESLIPQTVARGALELPGPAAPPPSVDSAAWPNPCWDFLVWCRDTGLLGEPDAAGARGLFADRVDALPHTRLPGDLRWARTAVLGTLGAYRRGRQQYEELLRSPRQARAAALALGNHLLNHGGRPVARVLRAGVLIPPLTGRSRGARERAERKRLTVLSRVGDHARVIKATSSLSGDAVSTYAILRAESLRVAGSLDAAAATARRAYERALTEHHLVRIAHAAYQECQALTWADRADEAWEALENHLRPHAPLAASRWVAWADFIQSALLVRRGDVDQSRRYVERAVRGFAAEALVDGIVSAHMVLPTVARRAGDDAGFAAAVRAVREQMTSAADVTYYTRGHPFTDQLLMLEEAEFARIHTRDTARARELFTMLASSAYPLQAAFGQLGLALTAGDTTVQRRLAEQARESGVRAGQRLVINRAELLLTGDPAATAELFFC